MHCHSSMRAINCSSRACSLNLVMSSWPERPLSAAILLSRASCIGLKVHLSHHRWFAAGCNLLGSLACIAVEVCWPVSVHKTAVALCCVIHVQRKRSKDNKNRPHGPEQAVARSLPPLIQSSDGLRYLTQILRPMQTSTLFRYRTNSARGCHGGSIARKAAHLQTRMSISGDLSILACPAAVLSLHAPRGRDHADVFSHTCELIKNALLQVKAKLGEFRPSMLAALVKAFGIAGYVDSGFYDMVSDYLEQNIKSIGPQHLADIAFGASAGAGVTDRMQSTVEKVALDFVQQADMRVRPPPHSGFPKDIRLHSHLLNSSTLAIIMISSQTLACSHYPFHSTCSKRRVLHTALPSMPQQMRGPERPC